ncbi:MAG: D-glycero-alpha-D-manno-heptose-1,7-bisphosphate 7-phosphatase [Phycisphaerales bacterium]
MAPTQGTSALDSRPAIFLDRDDTLIECNSLEPPLPPGKVGDLTDPERVRLLPGVREGLTRLKQAGFVLVVVSNQGAVARGACGVADVVRVNTRVVDLLGPEALPTAFYFCPFHPNATGAFAGEHSWRKPGPGMIQAACREHHLDLQRSWLIGDGARDIEAAIAAGISAERAVRVPIDPERDVFTIAVERVMAGDGSRRK